MEISENTEREDYRRIENPKLKVSYDESGKNFIYEMPNGGSFSLNVPIGGITDRDVSIKTGNNTWIKVMTKDGVSILPEKKEFSSVSEAIAAVSVNRVRKARTQGDGRYFFQAVSSVRDETGVTYCSSSCGFLVTEAHKAVSIERLSAPYGYEISEIYTDGKAVNIRDRTLAELESDGEIVARFKPTVKDIPDYSSVFIKDSIAPAIIFNPSIDREEMTEPVSYFLAETGGEVHVFLDNKEIDTGGRELFMDGEYRLVAVDETGNSNEYSFRIKQKTGVSPIMFQLLIGIALIGALFVVVFEHRRMRIL